MTAPERPHRSATIRTAADHAGLSKSLVSLALQGSPNVSESNRQAVRQAIDELGYRPNAIARELTARPINIVGVLLNDLRNPWFVDGLEGLTSVLHEQGLRTLLAGGRMDRRTDDSLLQGFLELRVDGLVLVGTMASSPTIVEAVTAVPTVVAASGDITLPQVDVVANDARIGTDLAVNRLIDLGHTRIAHLAGSFGAPCRPTQTQLRRDHARKRPGRSGTPRAVRYDGGGRGTGPQFDPWAGRIRPPRSSRSRTSPASAQCRPS